MSGVPRLATAATTSAMNIRAGTSSRASERATGNTFTATPPTGLPVMLRPFAFLAFELCQMSQRRKGRHQRLGPRRR